MKRLITALIFLLTISAKAHKFVDEFHANTADIDSLTLTDPLPYDSGGIGDPATSPAEGYILKWVSGAPDWSAAGAGHTQNTDTGTNQETYVIGNASDAGDTDISFEFGSIWSGSEPEVPTIKWSNGTTGNNRFEVNAEFHAAALSGGAAGLTGVPAGQLTGTAAAINGNAITNLNKSNFAGSSFTANSVLFGSSATAIGSITPNATSTNMYIRQVSGGVPAYVQPAFSHLAGSATAAQLPVLSDMLGVLDAGNGGTGIATWATGAIPHATGSTTLAQLVGSVTGDVVTWNGSLPVYKSPVYPGGPVDTLVKDSTRYINDLGDCYAVGYIKSGIPTGTASAFEACLDTTTANLYRYVIFGGWSIVTTLPAGSRALHIQTGTDTSGNSGTYTPSGLIYTSNGVTASSAAPTYRDAAYAKAQYLTGLLGSVFYNGSAWVSGFSSYLPGVNSASSGTSQATYRINALSPNGGDSALYFGAGEVGLEIDNSKLITNLLSLNVAPAGGGNVVLGTIPESGVDSLTFGAADSINAKYGLFWDDIHTLQQLYASRGIVCGLGRSYFTGSPSVTGALIISTEGAEGVPTAGSQISRLYTSNTGLHIENHPGGDFIEGSVSQKLFFDDVIDADNFIGNDLTASRAVTTDANKKLSSSSVTSTELGYVSGVTSALQPQIDALPRVRYSNTANSSTISDDTGVNDFSLTHSLASTIWSVGKVVEFDFSVRAENNSGSLQSGNILMIALGTEYVQVNHGSYQSDLYDGVTDHVFHARGKIVCRATGGGGSLHVFGSTDLSSSASPGVPHAFSQVFSENISGAVSIRPAVQFASADPSISAVCEGFTVEY